MKNTPCQEKAEKRMYQCVIIPGERATALLFCQFCGDVLDLVPPNPQPAEKPVAA